MKQVLRVFISSTFNDFRLERAVLQKFIFPELKKLAHEKNISFLPIDLRWGVPEEAQLDHRTMDICLSEVERSVTDPHPDFIILSGDKYGWIPLSRVIEKEEFEKILKKFEELKKDSRDIKILKEWYKLDRNQIPVSYILRPRDEVTDKNYTDYEIWADVENKIRNLLQKAVIELDLEKDKKEKYFTSATYEEFKAFLKNKNGKNNLISFIREFKDLDEAENKEKIKKFRKEIKENTSQENLKELKTTAKVYEELIKKYSKENREDIEEVFKDINSLEEIKEKIENKEFAEYLIEFANFIKERIKTSFENIKTDFSETDYHKDFKNYLISKPFIGRDEEIKEIFKAMKESDKVLIYGESGVGKSAIMAHITDKLEKENKYQLVYRFSGATQESSNIINLLSSILEELGIEVEVNNKNIKQQLLEIREKLNQIDKKIIIIIDAIDQLGSANIDELEWLPNNKNIKIVISAINDKNYEKDSLYFQKLNQIFNSIEIKRIKNKREMLKKLLEIENRTLQKNQFEYVLNKKDSNKPLYLSLAKEELKFWRSKDELTDNPEEETKTKRYLAPTQKEIIKEFFNNLKTMHNIVPELADKTLGYISASQEHLSEKLLLEVLSKDKELLSKVENKYHKNLTNELPPAVWSRFRWMIKDYIKEDKNKYINFYHREFEDIIDEFYNEDLAKKLTLIFEKLFPNESTLIAHAHTLANRYNHKEEIEQNEYKRIVKKLEEIEEEKIINYLLLFLNKGNKISNFIDPSNAIGYYKVGRNLLEIFYKKNKYDILFALLLKQYGKFNLKLNHLDEAKEMYNKSMKIMKNYKKDQKFKKHYVHLLADYANFYDYRNDVERAIKIYKKILTMDNIPYSFYPKIGDFLFKYKNFKQAAQAYKKGLKYYKNDLFISIKYNWTLVNLGKLNMKEFYNKYFKEIEEHKSTNTRWFELYIKVSLDIYKTNKKDLKFLKEIEEAYNKNKKRWIKLYSEVLLEIDDIFTAFEILKPYRKNKSFSKEWDWLEDRLHEKSKDGDFCSEMLLDELRAIDYSKNSLAEEETFYPEEDEWDYHDWYDYDYYDYMNTPEYQEYEYECMKEEEEFMEEYYKKGYHLNEDLYEDYNASQEEEQIGDIISFNLGVPIEIAEIIKGKIMDLTFKKIKRKLSYVNMAKVNAKEAREILEKGIEGKNVSFSDEDKEKVLKAKDDENVGFIATDGESYWFINYNYAKKNYEVEE